MRVINVNVPLALAKHHSDITLKLVLKNHFAICNQVLYFSFKTTEEFKALVSTLGTEACI